MKHAPGFAPINIKAVGEISLFIGTICVLVKALDYFSGGTSIPNLVLIFGVAMLILAGYLLLVVAKK